MKNYGKVRSTIRPEQVEYTATKVFVSSNVKEVTEEMEGQRVTEFEYDLTKYDKDEYIQILSDKNESLENEVTSTQEALCEVYELMI